MIKKQLILVLIVFLGACSVMLNKEQLINAKTENAVEGKLRLNGFYCYEESRSLRGRAVSRIIPYFLYDNGIVLFFSGISNENGLAACYEEFRDDLKSDIWKKYSHWGIYRVDGDTLKMQQIFANSAIFVPFQTRNILERQAIIQNDSSFNIFRAFTYNKGKTFQENLYEKIFKFRAHLHKPDSTLATWQ